MPISFRKITADWTHFILLLPQRELSNTKSWTSRIPQKEKWLLSAREKIPLTVPFYREHILARIMRYWPTDRHPTNLPPEGSSLFTRTTLPLLTIQNPKLLIR